MQHTFISRELLLCQAGIGAAPIDKYKYPAAPGVAARYCTLLLGVVAAVVACSPCGRSTSNLTAAAYHHLACSLLRAGPDGVHPSHCAAQSYKDWPPRPGSDRTRRRQPKPGTAEASRGPWSTNAEEMTLWICSAARNEGGMAERVPRTM